MRLRRHVRDVRADRALLLHEPLELLDVLLQRLRHHRLLRRLGAAALAVLRALAPARGSGVDRPTYSFKMYLGF